MPQGVVPHESCPMVKLLLALHLLFGTGALWAESWAPIPPEVWAIKEDPAKGIRDAVVLENRVRFTHVRTEFVLRARILSGGNRIPLLRVRL